MSSPGTLSAALAFLPQWWQETADPLAFDGLLAGWARACGWRACGFMVHGENGPVVKTVLAGGHADLPAPLEVPDALRRLKGGEATVLYSVPNTAGRVFAAVQPAGRPAGVLWAEKTAGQPWADAERAYLALTARTVERSPALAAVAGPIIDPDRLFQRLGDAAVIAGRMAHDFDNLLQGIIGFSDLSVPLLPPGSQAAKYVRRDRQGRPAGRRVHPAVAPPEPQRAGEAEPGRGVAGGDERGAAAEAGRPAGRADREGRGRHPAGGCGRGRGRCRA